VSRARLLRHRFVYVPLGLAGIVAAWNVYVAANNDGVIEGEVRDAAGAPVADATVIFFERNFVNYQEKLRTRTDARGAYRFNDMQVHIGQLEARLEDGRRSERIQLQLWFRAQHTRVGPLVVHAPRP
jgi:protocatechuate 3,4-dioxygenase beta subunit